MITYEEFCDLLKTEYIFALDNNVLLDLYRYPPDITKDLITIFDKIMKNLWIPYQAYNEFLANFNKIRGDEKKKYKNVENILKDIINNTANELKGKVNGYRRYNYSGIDDLQSNIDKQITLLKDIVDKYINDNNNEIIESKKFLEEDKAKEFVDRLYQNNRVGNNVSFEERIKILAEGKIRYDNLLPPGFMDKDKDGMDKYGDLFIWKELISLSKEKSANIIFVTQDTKEDWWIKDKRENPICIRNELKQEFSEICLNKQVDFLTLDVFYSYMSKYMNLHSLSTTLVLGFDVFVKNLESMKSISNDITDKLIEFYESIEENEYITDEYTEAELIWDDWKISNGNITIDTNNGYAKYYLELEGSLDYSVYYEDSEQDKFEIGELNIYLIGNAIVRRKIKDDYSCADNLEFGEIQFEIKDTYYKDLYELIGEQEEAGRVEMMDAIENYYYH